VQIFFEEVISRLAQAQVEFVVVGGVSGVLQGAPIVTRDLDICYRRTSENITRLATALAPLQPQLRGFPPDLPYTFDARSLQLGTNFTLLIGQEELDLLGEMSAIGNYERIIDQADEMLVAGFKVKVLSLAHLIATKKAAGRPKDLAVLPTLQATLEEKQRMSTPPYVPPSVS
jgi:hypothetical protein